MNNKVLIKIKNWFTDILNTIESKSIQVVITISFTFVTILAMLFVGILISNKFSYTAEQNIIVSNQEIIKQVNINLEQYIKSMTQVSDWLKVTIKEPEFSKEKLEEQMKGILNTRDDIVTLALFSEKGHLIASTPYTSVKKNVNVQNQEWFNEAIKNNYKPYFSPPHVQNLFEKNYKWVISLSKKVEFVENGTISQGILLVDMNFKSMDQLCQKVNLGKKGYIYIVDQKGNIIYHPQQQLIYAGLKYENHYDYLKYNYGSFIQKFNKESRMITINKMRFVDWKIVGVSYMDEIIATKREITNFAAWVIFFGVIVFIFISAYISSNISQPIKKLEKSMKMVEEGIFDIDIDIKGEYEVVRLSKTFNIMVSKIKQLMNQIVLEQEAKRKSEFDALQAQINPHFLYNTLDSIVWMAENDNKRDAITMVTSLAKLFRISISKGKNIISVEEELNHIKNYMIIQKIRYKNKFEFSIDVQDEVLKYKTVKLILQPIIENSIYHGIEYMVDEGYINIYAKKENEKLLFIIEDNGVGMPREEAKKILSQESRNSKGSGVGLKNVHDRIQLYFGKEYGIDLESELEEGTKVRIWLPLMEEEYTYEKI